MQSSLGVGMNFRPQRVKKLIREELARIILREVEFPGALVTVTDVDVDNKLENAKVKVSVIPGEFSLKVLELLRKEAGRLHHLLFKKINIKPMPLISFEIDYGVENAARVEKRLLENQ